MLVNLRQITPLLLSYGLLTTAAAMFSSLLALRSQGEAFDLKVVGFMTAAYSAGILIGARRAPDIVGRVGHIRAFGAFASLVSIIALLHLLWIHPVAWITFRFFNGYLMAGMFTVTESWLNKRSTGATRGKVLAIYMIINYAAAGGGQLIIPTSSPDTFVLFCIASILFSLALIPLLLSQSPAPETERAERLPLAKLLKVSPLGFSGAFCAGAIAAPFWGLGSLYGQGIGLDLNKTALFMAITLCSGMLLQIPVGILSDRVGRRKVIGIVALISALAAIALVLPHFADTPGNVILVGIIWGSTTLTLYALAVAHTNDQAPSGKTVEVATAVLFVYGIGAILGPIIASMTMNQIGPRGLFAYQFLVSMLLAVIAFMRWAKKPKDENRRQFIPVGTTGMMSEELLAKAQERGSKIHDSD